MSGAIAQPGSAYTCRCIPHSIGFKMMSSHTFVLLWHPQNESSDEDEEEEDEEEEDDDDDDEDDVDDDEEEEAMVEGEVDPNFRLELMKVLQQQNALVGCVQCLPI